MANFRGGLLSLVGRVMVVVGCKARIGAFLLLLFLAVATFYFHDFWEFSDARQKATSSITS